MAQKVDVKFIDDLDGSEAVGTVTFSLNNRAYEIDLSDDNTNKLHDALAPFIEGGRKAASSNGTPAAKGRKAAGAGSARADREQTQAIREWARQQGHQVSERGRIPKSVQEAFEAAH